MKIDFWFLRLSTIKYLIQSKLSWFNHIPSNLNLNRFDQYGKMEVTSNLLLEDPSKFSRSSSSTTLFIEDSSDK